MEQFLPTTIRLTVAAFSERAIKDYEHAGFERRDRCLSPVRQHQVEFLVMSRRMTLVEGVNMRCPVDESELIMSERQGVEIDYCPNCRGVWLDQGELDKIVERGSTDSRRSDDNDDWDERCYKRREGYDPQRSHGRPPYKKKRRSFLGDLFDID